METKTVKQEKCQHKETEKLLGYGGYHYGDKCKSCRHEKLKDGFVKAK